MIFFSFCFFFGIKITLLIVCFNGKSLIISTKLLLNETRFDLFEVAVNEEEIEVLLCVLLWYIDEGFCSFFGEERDEDKCDGVYTLFSVGISNDW